MNREMCGNGSPIWLKLCRSAVESNRMK